MYYICLFHSVDLQEVEQAKALCQCRMENPHNPLHESVEDTKGRHKSWMNHHEPVWPSGKAVGGRTSVRYRFGSPFSSKRLWFVDTVL